MITALTKRNTLSANERLRTGFGSGVAKKVIELISAKIVRKA